VGVSPRWLVNERLSLEPSYSFNHVALSTGAFDTHIARLRVRYSFSDRVLTDALLQYNSVAGLGGAFVRLRYIYRTGDDIYLVLNQSRAWNGTYEGLLDRTITAKATYSFNF